MPEKRTSDLSPNIIARFSILLLIVFCGPGLLSACTIFTVVDGNTVLMGNSEDFTKQGAVWFVPAAEGRFGRVNVGFHNFINQREDFAQGSMNEKGLAFDAAVTAKVPWTTDEGKETPDNLLEKIMNECATVSQAVDYFEKFNCPHLASSQFMFADATGDSAVIAWMPKTGLSIVRRSGNHQVATNTRLELSSYRCQRWTRATRELASDTGTVFERARQTLNSIHQHGPGGFTSYSCIYDLRLRKVYLYALGDFDHVAVLDLKEELAAGAVEYLMKELYETEPDLKSIKALPQRTDYGTRIHLSKPELTRFAGTYSPDIAPEIRVRVEATDDGLRVHNPGQPPADLFPEAATVFRLAPDRGQVTFHVPTDGSISGLTLHKASDDVHAARVE